MRVWQVLCMRVCSVEGCGRPHEGKGWCKFHYQRVRQGLSLTAPKRATRSPIPCKGHSCRAPGCSFEARRAGYCIGHFRRTQRGASVLAPLEPRLVAPVKTVVWLTKKEHAAVKVYARRLGFSRLNQAYRELLRRALHEQELLQARFPWEDQPATRRKLFYEKGEELGMSAAAQAFTRSAETLET